MRGFPTRHSNGNHFEEYQFPFGLSANTVFENHSSLFDFLEKTLIGKTPYKNLLSLYEVTYKPVRNNCEEIIFQCQFCKANITAKRQPNDQFMVKQVFNKHKHLRAGGKYLAVSNAQANTRKASDPNYNPNYPLLKSTVSNRQLESRLPSVADVWKDRQEGFKQILLTVGHPKKQELDKWSSTLTQYLKSHQMNIIQSKSTPEKRTEWLVCASQTMLSSFKRYDDITVVYPVRIRVEFDEQPVKLWLFLTVDNNSRLLLTGIGILFVESTFNYQRVLEQMAHLHNQPLKTVFVTYETLIHLAYPSHSNANKPCNSIALDQGSVLQEMRKSLKGTQAQMQSSMRLFSDIFQCRSPLMLYQHFQNLVKIPQQHQIMFEDFVQKGVLEVSAFAFQRNFLGLKSNLIEITEECVHRILQGRQTISLIKMLHKMLELEDVLLKESSNRIFYAVQIEQNFKDERMAKLRMQVESAVLKRFLQNYLIGVMQYQLRDTITDRFSNSKSYIVRHKFHMVVFCISEWKCDCEETAKTGIPCPHVILAAIQDQRKEYVELFYARWTIKSGTQQGAATQMVEQITTANNRIITEDQ